MSFEKKENFIFIKKLKMNPILNRNDFIFKKSLISRYKPCVVEQLCNKQFVIGTYELIEPNTELEKKFNKEDLERINQRAGTIEIVSESFIISHVHECYYGGVFDLTVSNDRLLVAHANGIFAIYFYEPSIELYKHFQTKSNMLTTVSCFLHHDKFFYYTAGSTGILSCIQKDTEQISNEICILDEPIWTINTKLKTLHNIPVILIGSEDAKWRLFNYLTKKVFYQNSDAESGVTSFNVTSMNDNPIILVGSYDGYVRIYLTNCNVDEMMFQRLYKINIGGGVWRLYSRLIGTTCLEIFGSAMYSGAFILTIERLDQSSNKCKNLEDFDEKLSIPLSNDPESVLIYGTFKNERKAVICSYNERLIHCFNIH